MNREPIVLPIGAQSHLFFIGIGGVSMSALAVIAKNHGFRVSGSDRSHSRFTELLESEGVTVHYGHNSDNIRGADAIIYNAAISEENPELSTARKTGIPCIYRADFLAYLMQGYKNGIGVAGMHGKTTTSAMLSHLFLYADRDPAILIGAELPELGRDFRSGGGDDFIFEACEYRDSFLSFRPSVAVVLNEEPDHPDWFHSMEQIRASFAHYLDIPGEDGYAILNADDTDVMESAEHSPAHHVTFGIHSPDADYRACDISYSHGCPSFTVKKHGVPFVHLTLSVIGEHNVMNATAAVAAADISGLSPDVIEGGLASFRGVGRRMEYRGELLHVDFPVPVYEDFGHHPTEVATTLRAASGMGYKRLLCVYQPHTYSRTADLFEEFVGAFDAADFVYFDEIYAAREVNTWGISSRDLAERIPHAVFCENRDALRERIYADVRAGDLLIIMGAGDIGRLAHELTEV